MAAPAGVYAKGLFPMPRNLALAWTGVLLVTAALSGLLAAGCATTGPLNTPEAGDTSVTAAALSNPTGSAAIRVAWGSPQNIPLVPTARAGYVVGYELYRSTGPGVAAVATQLIAFIEGGASRSYVDAVADLRAPELVTLTTNEDTGYVSVNRQAGDAVPAITQESDTITYNIVSTPPTPGQSYYYLLRVVSKKLGATPFDPTDGNSDLSGQLVVSTGYGSSQATVLEAATPVSPPNAPAPGSTDVDPATALFEWTPALGADTYCLELCTDRGFPASQVVRSTEYFVATSTTTNISRTFQGADVASAFGNVTAPIYWRVGARRSTNPVRPVGATGANAGYVYSDYFSFQALESPPNTP